jgi:hypothetical protein
MHPLEFERDCPPACDLGKAAPNLLLLVELWLTPNCQQRGLDLLLAINLIPADQTSLQQRTAAAYPLIEVISDP